MKKRPIQTIGIIGLGRFGSLLAKNLHAAFPEKHINGFDSQQGINLDGVIITTLQEVAKSDIIFICVPISSFEETVIKLKKHISPRAVVIDVCSVKVHPAKIMEEWLPSTVCSIASHPLFGPDSAQNGLQGLKIVVWPVRHKIIAREIEQNVFKPLGLDIIKMSPEDHDRLMAISQSFTHLIGRIGSAIGVRETQLDTQSFKNLLSVQNVVVADSEQLFLDMQRFNPFTQQMRRNVKKALETIETNILLQ